MTLAKFMRRLLTGYVVTFNLRHRRSGHLFQNRYKSIVCDEDAYLLELVRYIHLNPLRAGIVSDLAELDRFRWSGHAVIMGQASLPTQATEEVLLYFGKRAAEARRLYRAFVEDGIAVGNREELAGGGRPKTADSEPGRSLLGDPRILGDAAFADRLRQQGGCNIGYRSGSRSLTSCGASRRATAWTAGCLFRRRGTPASLTRERWPAI
jgi:hypothetical protein